MSTRKSLRTNLSDALSPGMTTAVLAPDPSTFAAAFECGPTGPDYLPEA